MKSLPFLFLLLGAILLGSCKTAPKHSFSAATLERQSGPNCATDEGTCARLELSYPLAEGPFAQMINDSVQSALVRILSTLNPDGEYLADINQLADQFIKSYVEFTESVPDYEIGWWIESSYEIHRNTDKLISIELMVSAFSGGAHPIGFSQTLNFFASDGKPVAWKDIVIDEKAWLQLVVKEFKQTWDLPETASLQEEGFFWDEQPFLPANFAFTDEGIYLIYNVYEAAAYALGPTEFLIPYEKTKGLLKEL